MFLEWRDLIQTTIYANYSKDGGAFTEECQLLQILGSVPAPEV